MTHALASTQTATALLTAHVAGLRCGSLPRSAINAAKRVTLDALGVMLPASGYAPGRIMTAYVGAMGEAGPATVVGTGLRASTAHAALANGTLAAEMELDDVCEGTHPSSVYVPALLAVAEDVGASGADWIAALVAAYDTGIRLGVAMDMTRMFSRGFHPTSVCGAIGAAAGAARLLGLDAAHVDSAIGLAGSQACGLLTWELEQEHYTKSFQSGVAARNAVVAAELAAAGYTGAPGTLDGPHSMFDSFSTHRDFERLTRDLGVRYEIEHTGYKFYNCCRAIHTALDIVLDLAAALRFGAADVAGITVWLPPFVMPVVDGSPLTTHNLQYIMAVALADGEITRAQTAAERRADPALSEMAGRVDLRSDPALERRGAKVIGPTRVELRLRDGRAFTEEREGHRGGTAAPVSDEAIERKFLQLATPALGAGRAQAVVKAVGGLEGVSLRDLAALLSRVDPLS